MRSSLMLKAREILEIIEPVPEVAMNGLWLEMTPWHRRLLFSHATSDIRKFEVESSEPRLYWPDMRVVGLGHGE